MNEAEPDTRPLAGSPSPLEPTAGTPGTPLTRGFAVLLLGVNLAALGWMAHSQDQRLDLVESLVSTAASSPMPSDVASTTDPQLCWMLGVLANAQGKGDVVARMGSGSDSLSDCQVYGMRGARGQDMGGN